MKISYGLLCFLFFVHTNLKCDPSIKGNYINVYLTPKCLKSKIALVSYELVYIFINNFSYSNKLMLSQVNSWSWYCNEMNATLNISRFVSVLSIFQVFYTVIYWQ